MTYSEQCDHCGNKVTVYMHRLNKQLVKSLRLLVDRYERTHTVTELGELPLTVNQYSNFQKLQYFGLIEHVSSRAAWIPTPLGVKFIHGEATVLDPAGSFKRKAIPEDHHAWNTYPKKRVRVNVNDIDSTAWKQRIDYQMEKITS